MNAQWLQPIAEKDYIRLLYIGRLVPDAHKGPNYQLENITSQKRLEDMMVDIWKQASVFNQNKFISGHLSCAATLHVVQVLEGKEKVVLSLMSRIRKDPRVIIEKVFTKKIQTMHRGWAMTMCYSFEISKAQLNVVQDDNLTLDELFDMMKNTFEVKDLLKFYKESIEIILLKYISTTTGKEWSFQKPFGL